MLRYFLVISFIFISEFAHSHATFNIENVSSDKGYIEINIFKDSNSFLKNEPFYNSRKIATKGITTFPVKDLHEGEISIFVYHDENADNKLNTSLFWIPKEGYAYSNNYIPKGRPKFDNTIVYLTHGIPINLKMNY
tara:strand:- start:1684 stop:2091 length:408 start_codon:yes stop_codon:yes gene_type:complete